MWPRASMSLPSSTARGSHSADQLHALGGDAVGHRVEAGRAIGLEAVRQSVHAGGGGDVRRQAEGELRIEDDDGRQHLRVEDDLLHARRLVEDHPGAADFGAGAGGGRHRDDRRDPGGIGARPPIRLVLEIPERPALARHEGDHLADVERAAAAEGDDAVVAAVAPGGEAGLDVGADRIGVDGAEEPGARGGARRRATIGSFARAPDR